MFIDKIAKKPTSQKYFSRLFGPEIQWENIYMLPYSVTVDTCTRYFQFKLSHNILFLKSRLFHITMLPTLFAAFASLKTRLLFTSSASALSQ